MGDIAAPQPMTLEPHISKVSPGTECTWKKKKKEAERTLARRDAVARKCDDNHILQEDYGI